MDIIFNNRDPLYISDCSIFHKSDSKWQPCSRGKVAI